MIELKPVRRTPKIVSAIEPFERFNPERNEPVDNSQTAAYSRFKVQLKRAVDSVDAPEYLIDAIKTAIRR